MFERFFRGFRGEVSDQVGQLSRSSIPLVSCRSGVSERRGLADSAVSDILPRVGDLTIATTVEKLGEGGDLAIAATGGRYGEGRSCDRHYGLEGLKRGDLTIATTDWEVGGGAILRSPRIARSVAR